MDYMVYDLSTLEDVSNFKFYTQGYTANQINIGFPKHGRTATGILQSIQYIVKFLLTERGTNRFLPEEGTSLITLLGSPITQQSLQTVQSEIIIALPTILESIREIQASIPTEPEDEIINLTLQEFSFDQNTGIVDVFIIITTPVESIPVVLQI